MGEILLVTGGTGSFGNAVLEGYLNSDKFSEIRIFSRDEKKQDDMRNAISNENVHFYIGDVRDRESVARAMDGVNYVFHAAALKQVPSCEFFPMQAVQTNVLGTSNVLEEACRYGVKKVIVLSTDKAVYPINAMGMSKALMEKVAIARGVAGRQRTQIACTRYGNVMASRGSVIPRFVSQIKAGERLTITDPEMTRFMMTLSDAVELVFYAFENLNSGDVFVQKAPAATLPVLAEALQNLYGVSRPTRIIGTRHGEKVYEVLVNREDMSKAVDEDSYFRVPADTRGLNYSAYFTEGEVSVSEFSDYHSHNTHRLGVEEMQDLLLKLPLIRRDVLGEEYDSDDFVSLL